MRKIYPYLLIIVLTLSCKDNNKKDDGAIKSDLPFYKLKGHVSSVSEKSYATIDGIDKGESKHEIATEHDTDLTFNDKGVLLSEKKWLNATKLFEETTFNGHDRSISTIQYQGGIPSIKTQYEWDKSGKNNLSVTRRNTDNSQYDRIAMIYKEGKIVEKVTYDAQNDPTEKVTYKYDKKGNLIEENIYLNLETVQYKNVYEYDAQNRKVAESNFNKDGKLQYKTTLAYKGDKVTDLKTINSKGEVSYMEKSSYDGKGNLVNQTIFDKSDNSQMTDTYVYDKAGNMIQSTLSKNNKLMTKGVYKYDNHANLTSSITSNGDGVERENRSYAYEYDKKGNWIKKIYYKDNTPTVITHRTISYFK
jgi:YD repeat-containing protein